MSEEPGPTGKLNDDDKGELASMVAIIALVLIGALVDLAFSHLVM